MIKNSGHKLQRFFEVKYVLLINYVISVIHRPVLEILSHSFNIFHICFLGATSNFSTLSRATIPLCSGKKNNVSPHCDRHKNARTKVCHIFWFFFKAILHQTISIYWCYLLQNHVDSSTKSKQFVTWTSVCP